MYMKEYYSAGIKSNEITDKFVSLKSENSVVSLGNIKKLPKFKPN